MDKIPPTPNSMGQNHNWEATNSSASQETPCIVWNMKVSYCVPKSLPPIPVLRQRKPFRVFAFYFLCKSSKWSPYITPRAFTNH
jgi:hypothetical protein